MGRRAASSTKDDLDTREALIAATVACMSEVGYFDTTTSLVAARAGLSRGALQYHFPKRQDLLVAVIDHVGRSLVESIKTVPIGSGPVETRLRHICEAYLSVFQSPTYLAQLQIWLGVRNDAQLHKKVEKHVSVTAAEQDRLWTRAFADLDVEPELIGALRRLMVSAVRGVSLRAGRRLSPTTFPSEIDLLCEMAAATLRERSAGAGR